TPSPRLFSHIFVRPPTFTLFPYTTLFRSPQLIHRLFPDALSIVMHRNPLDQIDSFTRSGTFAHATLGANLDGHALIVEAAKYWVDVTSRLSNTAQANPRQVQVIYYEDLCRSPEMTLRHVLEHLE